MGEKEPLDGIGDGGTECATCHRIILIGMWPFCPHPKTGGFGIERDEIPGGVTLENYGPTPVTFYSHSERRRYMAAQGLREKETFCPAPGTDVDPQGIPNPKGYKDAQTLENGKVLMLRQQGAPEKEWDPVEAGVMTDLQTGVITERDAIAIAQGDAARMSRFHRRTANGRE